MASRPENGSVGFLAGRAAREQAVKVGRENCPERYPPEPHQTPLDVLAWARVRESGPQLLRQAICPEGLTQHLRRRDEIDIPRSLRLQDLLDTLSIRGLGGVSDLQQKLLPGRKRGCGESCPYKRHTVTRQDGLRKRDGD